MVQKMSEKKSFEQKNNEAQFFKDPNLIISRKRNKT